MVHEKYVYPFFSKVEDRLVEIAKRPEDYIKELLARNPVFYNRTMFRAFLGLNTKDMTAMTAGEYVDYCLMLNHVIHMWDRIAISPFAEQK